MRLNSIRPESQVWYEAWVSLFPKPKEQIDERASFFSKGEGSIRFLVSPVLSFQQVINRIAGQESNTVFLFSPHKSQINHRKSFMNTISCCISISIINPFSPWPSPTIHFLIHPSSNSNPMVMKTPELFILLIGRTTQ